MYLSLSQVKAGRVVVSMATQWALAAMAPPQLSGPKLGA
jgi:hypothetical protein